MNDQPGSIDGGGGEPHPQLMEQRVTALENDMREIRADLKRLVLDVAEMKGRLSQMPTTVQLIGLIFAIFGAAFALLKFTGHQ